jgi:hypothetical protein
MNVISDDAKLISRLGNEPSWCIITATVEAEGAHDCPANIAATNRLWSTLADRGYDYVMVGGQWAGVDQGVSFLVFDISPVVSLSLGRDFRQDSVVTDRGLVECTNGLVLSAFARVSVATADAINFTTLPGGTRIVLS